MCILVIAGVSGNLSWVPAWPHWLRNIAQATAAVVFVVVYVGVAQREREARQRAEALPPKSRSSPPRTSATAWRARSTTRWATT
jgi:membrane protein implicated in regulation of membrane protease activity